MKCPKCGYIGFESTDKCRNCGYEFSLAAPRSQAFDLPLKIDDSAEAPRDIPFSIADFPRQPASPRGRPRLEHLDMPLAKEAVRDLPLFGGDEGALLPKTPRAPAPRQVAVPRRAATPPSCTSPCASAAWDSPRS
jgi:hypothetical protein